MMTMQTAKAAEQIKRTVRNLRRLAAELDERGLWQDAEALHLEADELTEAAEAIELDATEENTDGELLAA